MSLGSWALFFHSVFSSTAAGLQLLADVTQRDVLPGPRRLIGILGLPFSVLLSGYTGVLLVATNIPVWWRAFPLLSPAFVSSAYSTSLAALSVLLRLGDREREDTARRIARAEVFCLSAELGFLTAGTIRLGKIGKPLTAGRLGMIFWPVVYVGGVLVPLILQLNGLLQSKREQPQLRSWSRPPRAVATRAVTTAAVATRVIGRRTTATEVVVTTPVTRRMAMATLTLVGGFAFRALMIFAGRESARRPQDYFEMTRSRDR
jgi:formate-dependent nitrite reductase membrane component NrfD